MAPATPTAAGSPPSRSGSCGRSRDRSGSKSQPDERGSKPDEAFPALRAARETRGPAVTEPLLEVENLVKHFPVKRGLLIDREVDRVRAVDGVGFSVARGETL